MREKRYAIGLLLAVLLLGNAGRQPACGDDPCFPGSEPGYTPLPPRAYLPLVQRAGAAPQPPPPLSCDTPEVEPNDTHTVAQALAGCVAGSASWDGDPDWYRVNLCSGPHDLALALDGPAGADLDLYLYGDPPGFPLYRSEGTGVDESIAATGLVTGTYYVLVQPAQGSGSYVLNVEVTR
jgi:hypothetical protein